MKTHNLLLGLVAWAALLPAQSYYPHHNITFGLGGGMPKGDLGGLFRNRPGITVDYGWRFDRYLQADFGFDTVFGAAGTREFEQTVFGFSRIRDYQFFIPFGGRAILPLAHDRLLLSAGGGGMWLKYSELLRQPSSYYRVDCISCTTRSGWGSYALGDISTFIDQGHHFRVGGVIKLIRGYTEGEPVQAVTSPRTHDRWINVFGEVGFSF